MNAVCSCKHSNNAGFPAVTGKPVNYSGEGKIYNQVTYEINNRETEKREYERLLSIKDNYPKYVIRMDDFAGGNYEGVKTMHIADFLLDNSY